MCTHKQEIPVKVIQILRMAQLSSIKLCADGT